MPKSKGNAYFIACRKGAEEAAKELGVELIWDGPTDPDPAKQNEIVDTWITRGVDVIAVASRTARGSRRCCGRRARRGSRSSPGTPTPSPTRATSSSTRRRPQGIGHTLMDDAARIMGGKGEFAIITASLTAANMNEWMKYIEERRPRSIRTSSWSRSGRATTIAKKAFDGDEDDPEGPPEREADHGDLLARRCPARPRR